MVKQTYLLNGVMGETHCGGGGETETEVQRDTETETEIYRKNIEIMYTLLGSAGSRW